MTNGEMIGRLCEPQVLALRNEALAMGQEISERMTSLKVVLRALQAECEHPLVAECVDRDMSTPTTHRVCEVCGLYEREDLMFSWLRTDRVRRTDKQTLFRIRDELLHGTRVGIDAEDKPARRRS